MGLAAGVVSKTDKKISREKLFSHSDASRANSAREPVLPQACRFRISTREDGTHSSEAPRGGARPAGTDHAGHDGK